MTTAANNKFYSKCYWIGFEDGLVDAVCDTTNLTSREAFAYRTGFNAASKALQSM